jgi:hypothetical protein
LDYNTKILIVASILDNSDYNGKNRISIERRRGEGICRDWGIKGPEKTQYTD